MTIIVENNKSLMDVENNNNKNEKDVLSNGSTSKIADKPNIFDNEKYLKNYDTYTNDWIYQKKIPGRPYYIFDLEDLQKFKKDDKPWF
ncbi:hypothetical protein DICPUDRAFT_149746 [Dictyostelium purpureum]|uniref:Uncharacterized protein n=1 Tax=Dictyostelium purpureum TaxID=5786 RepID=F0ZEK0_DICPU|nr:uncharacterized protein DICPUDRAFT_149746 [Dictyostelium purpureum]EGC37641.1 hypothetical protein DICPUDRAFT_149746 [Dictyostelium purpureum]|eukprot:XP_003285829.1 hypothetical protein DICPUDRAFT_149746 [Dictyostelium purpureum]